MSFACKDYLKLPEVLRYVDEPVYISEYEVVPLVGCDPPCHSYGQHIIAETSSCGLVYVVYKLVLDFVVLFEKQFRRHSVDLI